MAGVSIGKKDVMGPWGWVGGGNVMGGWTGPDMVAAWDVEKRSLYQGPMALGAEGVLPGRQIESFLRVFKQFTLNLPRG